MYNCIDFDNEVRKERTIERRLSRSNEPMTANEWRFNDYGSAEPRGVSMDTIFSAYRDYRASQQWN
jgi:hypothetical protein